MDDFQAAWRAALIDHLRGNLDLLESFYSERLPQFGLSRTASYTARSMTNTSTPRPVQASVRSQFERTSRR